MVFLEDYANFLRQRRGKTTNPAPTTFSAIKANPLSSINNYTSLVIRGNDKTKQLTLLSQRKLALTASNTLFAS
jgi:hypothetical protein